MSNFEKPRAVSVSDSDYISKLVHANLHKDLHDNEELCPVCHGTGMTIENNVYGLTDDPDKTAGRFPYQHRALSFCQHCYNGVVHRCRLCGNILPRGILKCDCPQQKAIDWAEARKKEREEWEKAPIAPKEVEESMGMLYSDYYPNNEGFFSDWNEFFDAYAEYNTPEDEKPVYVWATETVEMHIDADNIVESATEDLYEEAIEQISSSHIRKLQDFLNQWCADSGVGSTYFESHKYKVRIPWEQYSEHGARKG